MKAKLNFAVAALLALICAVPGYTQVEGPPPEVVLVGQSQTINCTSSPQQIGVSIVNWVPGFQFQWSSGEADSVILVKPIASQNYNITVSNPSIGFFATRSFDISVENDPVKSNDRLMTVDKYTCPGSELTISVDVQGGYEPYAYHWEHGSNQPAPIIHPETSSIYRVTVMDRCGSASVAEVNVELEPHDPIAVPGPTTFEFDCVGDEVKVYPKLSGISGGIGYGYVYSFSDWEHSNESITVTAEEDMEVIAHVTDGCQVQVEDAQIELVKTEIEVPEVSDIPSCEGEPVKITDAENRLFYWEGGELHTEYTVAPATSTSYKLLYFDQCGDDHEVVQKVLISKPDAAFEYDVHAYANTVDLVPASLDEEEYTWYVNGMFLTDQPTAIADMEHGTVNEVTLETKDKNGCLNSSTRTVNVRDNFSAPTAMSPNGDGLNDEFRIEHDEEFAQFNIQIFDRWGQLIYHSNDQYFAWKGTDLINSQLNTLVYRIQGVTISGQIIDLTGTLTIVN